MQTKITTKIEHGQTVTTVHINGRQFSSLSIKNPEALATIIDLAKSLTYYERGLLDEIIGMLD